MRRWQRLVSGVEYWLNFEYSCFRGQLFSESYLSAGVGQLIGNGNYLGQGGMPIAGQPFHPAPGQKVSVGRPKEIDFVIATHKTGKIASQIVFAIECKWAGSSHATAQKLLKDALRLKSFRQANPACVCLLLVAGHYKKMKELLAKPIISKVLAMNHGGQKVTNLPTADYDVQELFHKIHVKDQSLKSIKQFRSALIKGELYGNNLGEFHAIAWKIE